MSFNNGIELTHTIDVDEGQVAISNPSQTFTDGIELSHTIEMSDGNIAIIGTVVAPDGMELDNTIELSDGNVTIVNSPQSFTIGAWIRAFALPKVPGDDSQEITLDDVIAIRATIYPESKGNPGQYAISTFQFLSDQANEFFKEYKKRL